MSSTRHPGTRVRLPPPPPFRNRLKDARHSVHGRMTRLRMNRPTMNAAGRRPRPFPRARCGALAVALPSLLLAGCGAAPPTAVANLEEIYRARDDQTGTYA